ncbi:uncharacterized protein LOC121956293 [Plectropomus leopardus]|uniref:uncharacterized protein LOC121956293 n=1 Tax=Plectropomus leopardus TaxID=160734 RepID=UPI001C4BD35C|nr:uncharacterized protein LOC121956293 [Plectropomus leopardus]
MIKMSRGVTSCCVALFFALTSVSAVQKLHSISALKQINFEQSVPKHSVVLLYWFANEVDIDNNNVIRLTFDPNSGDYGSHYYYNNEGVVDPLPRGNNRYRHEYGYYTIGNLERFTLRPLRQYVLNPPMSEFVGTNRDRIIICVRRNTGERAWQRIERVYITQHYGHQGSSYDPAHTYRISLNLLRQIREFSEGQNQQQLLRLRDLHESNADDSQLRQITATWGDLAGLGLLLLIVIQEQSSSNQHNNRRGNGGNQWGDDDASDGWSHDYRDFPNSGEVVVNFYDDEDHNFSRMTSYRGSGSYSSPEPRNNTKRWLCCICCIIFVCLFLLGIILLFVFMKR